MNNIIAARYSNEQRQQSDAETDKFIMRDRQAAEGLCI